MAASRAETQSGRTPILTAVCLAALVLPLSFSGGAVATPAIGADLGGSPMALNWITNAFMLTFGSALMAAMCDYADRWAGVLRLELTVFVDNAPAIALYRKFGFEIEGTHRAYALRDGRYADVHAMARLHPDPPALPAAG